MGDRVHLHSKQIRHKPPNLLGRPRELILVCSNFRSGINLSRITRLAGCAGIGRIITACHTKIDRKIARDAVESVNVERHRTVLPTIEQGKKEGWRLVALEQTDLSQSLFDYRFQRKTMLLIGNERLGVPEQELELADDVIEIPVYGHPFSYNVVTATTMAVYEYCRQFPEG
jgi:tRNA G18 (ribose-2'-O)-methylase SpoU